MMRGDDLIFGASSEAKAMLGVALQDAVHVSERGPREGQATSWTHGIQARRRSCTRDIATPFPSSEERNSVLSHARSALETAAL